MSRRAIHGSMSQGGVSRRPEKPSAPAGGSRHQSAQRRESTRAGRHGVDQHARAADRRRRRRARRPARCRPRPPGGSPRCWRRTRCSGSAAPGCPTVSSTTSSASAQRAASRSSSVSRALAIDRRRLGGQRRGDRLLDRVRPVLDPDSGCRRPAAVQQQPAQADRLDPQRLEVVQPLRVPAGGSPGDPARPASASQISTYSQGSSTSRCTTCASQPGGRSSPPAAPASRCPRTCAQLPSTCSVPPGRRAGRRPCRDDPLHQPVAGQGALPVGQPLAGASAATSRTAGWW